jgi:competence protein ComGC
MVRSLPLVSLVSVLTVLSIVSIVTIVTMATIVTRESKVRAANSRATFSALVFKRERIGAVFWRLSFFSYLALDY